MVIRVMIFSVRSSCVWEQVWRRRPGNDRASLRGGEGKASGTTELAGDGAPVTYTILELREVHTHRAGQLVTTRRSSQGRWLMTGGARRVPGPCWARLNTTRLATQTTRTAG